MVDTPGTRNDRFDGVVEMGWFTFCVAGITDGTDDGTMADDRQGVSADLMQVGVIV